MEETALDFTFDNTYYCYIWNTKDTPAQVCPLSILNISSDLKSVYPRIKEVEASFATSQVWLQLIWGDFTFMITDGRATILMSTINQQWFVFWACLSFSKHAIDTKFSSQKASLDEPFIQVLEHQSSLRETNTLLGTRRLMLIKKLMPKPDPLKEVQMPFSNSIMVTLSKLLIMSPGSHSTLLAFGLG